MTPWCSIPILWQLDSGSGCGRLCTGDEGEGQVGLNVQWQRFTSVGRQSILAWIMKDICPAGKENMVDDHALDWTVVQELSHLETFTLPTWTQGGSFSGLHTLCLGCCSLFSNFIRDMACVGEGC